MKTFSFFFPTPIPMARPRASRHQAQTSWSAELPAPVPCTHFFYALNMIMVGYVGIPCSYQQTLQNKGDHQQLQQLAHNNKKLSKSENAADFSPQKADQNMKQVGWQESYLCDMQASCIEYNAYQAVGDSVWKYCHESMNIRS